MGAIDEIINRQINHWDRIASILKREPGAPAAPEDEEEKKERPSQPVIAISRELGSGSRLVIEQLSRQTGYDVFGCNLIEEVAEDIHVKRRIVDRLDEATRSGIEGFIEGLLEGRHVDREEYFRSLLHVLRAFVVQGGVILLGRGSAHVVEPGEGLRVRLIASSEKRVENLMNFYDIDEDLAHERMKESDRQRREFVRDYYKIDPSDPGLYDLIINMGSVTPKCAAAVILRALEPLCE